MNRVEVDRLIQEKGLVAAGGELGVAALLYTYCCTIACRHCCFGCASSRPKVVMAKDKALVHLCELHRLGRVVHIAGGECMMFWGQLKELLVESTRLGVQPHFLESNCSFAVSDEIVRERFGFLKDCGVKGMLFSADPYHQAFVPPENFLRARRIADEVFGSANIWAEGAVDEKIRGYAAIAADPQKLHEFVRQNPPRMVGTARREFAHILPPYALDEVPPGIGWRFPHEGWPCMIEFQPDRIWEVHVDPYDNIQTNCGVILGNASQVSVVEVMHRGPENANLIASVLARQGPRALAELARDRHGFAIPDRVASKCDLCFQVRVFLRPFYSDILGPAEVYGR